MIRKNLLNFKLNLPEASIKTRFDSFMETFNPALERCPFCGAKGKCLRFAYYERYVVEVVGKKVLSYRIRILRVKCSCGRTHAIIPDFLVPYRQFSLLFILYILHIYFRHSMTVSILCETYDFSHTTLYRWKATFLKHRSWWIDFVRLGNVSCLAFLDQLTGTVPFSEFTMGFYRRTLFSFHQAHSNPANCRHLPPGWPPPEEATTSHVHSLPPSNAV